MPRRRAAEPRRRVAPWLLLSCEHGGNRVPPEYRRLFAGQRRLLASHRGLDIGALAAARVLQRRLGAPLVAATVTRLLVDLNRSIGHPALYSSLSRSLAAEERERLLARHYHPYRQLLHDWIAGRLARGEQVLQLSVHSFTPVLDGRRRNADVGLLYDPASGAEARFCRGWQARLAASARGWRVRRNYPYRGTADGLVVALRREFAGQPYLGIELELNQACLGNPSQAAALLADLAASLES
ncbi:MAG: hypothetical protein BroJett010_17420 [Gammaproteobacteria bacterium]|nr:MAG: hypothetical protein BroJett010_17420 [Gammaproteobacteria bacterium]